MMLNKTRTRDIKRDKYGIEISKDTNSCIFFSGWSNTDLDKLEFLNKIYGENYELFPEDDLICCFCGRDLDLAYTFIIHQLREAGLLPEDYISMCCFCNILACIGFWIPPEWFDTVVRESGIEIDGGCELVISTWNTSTKEAINFTVRIYDIDLTLKTGRVFNDVGMY